MITKELYNELAGRLGQEQLVADCDMREYTSFRAGGRAELLVLPKDTEELKFVLRQLGNSGVPYMVMGNGSNILVKDSGYHGVIVKMGEAFSWIRVEENRIRAGSGALMAAVARAALDAGLAGFEFASGIPGSLGGAVFMNAGAYGGEMCDIIKEVRVVSKDGCREYVADCERLALCYRHSVLQETGDIVTEVILDLKPGEKEAIRAEMKELADKRNAKQPVSLPSAGSFFKRPEGYFAGKLIQDAGMKGFSVGAAQVSPLHSGFIVNNGGATATEIIQLMQLVQGAVMDQFGVKLEPEVRIIGE